MKGGKAERRLPFCWRRGASAPAFSDCRKTFEELTAKDVEFVSQPKDQFYGVEAVFKDPFGNWLSMTQPKNSGDSVGKHIQ
jgi:hypothetical protein